ncbi:MAG: type II toxin-antitoxin system RelE/ParE family toxin [Lachnospiraceae bacterium]|nr:type II toxin-antitoxin system RelE/ParE family toxin [Lachnospiraceae bacterium]
MKNNIHYSPQARNDLDEIWEYISFELCNPQAAENSVNKIMDTVDELENFLEIGVPLSSVTDVESDYRFLVSGNYMVFYRVIMQDVYIDRVLYGRRDYLRILFPDLSQNGNEG